jgi:hypothetical protein
MKNWTYLFGMLFVFMTFSLVSCNKDNGDSGFNCTETFQFSQYIQDETDALIDANAAYLQNPTTENCENYRQALNAYIDEAERVEDCARQRGQAQGFEQAIAEARQDIEDLEC